jgi:DNA mismatch repair ATPase MutS
MLVGIASEIDAIHLLIGTIIDLDVVQSLAEASNKEGYCCPTFARAMKIEAGFHPMMEYTRNKEKPIANNIVSGFS